MKLLRMVRSGVLALLVGAGAAAFWSALPNSVASAANPPTDTVSVGPGVRYVCQTSAPSPVGRARDWVRCSDGHRMYTDVNNVDLDMSITSRGLTNRIADSVIPQYATVKISTTAEHVTLLLKTDTASQMTGVAMTAASGSGVVIQVQETQGVETPTLSDGTGTIATGDLVTISTTTDGRVVKGTSNSIGTATTACSAVADCQANVL